MRKILMTLGVVMALVIPAAALAASLDPGKFTTYINEGAKCKDSTQGAWYHFVLNQIDPAANKDSIVLTADFAPVGASNNVSDTPYATNNGTAHWWFFSSHKLLGASTTGGDDPGARAKLVLSSYACGKYKDGPPSDD